MTTRDQDWLAERFEESRVHLHGVAYRMLGSMSEAEDVVQEFWLRLTRADVGGVENLQAWLTTGVGRLCLDRLRARKSRPEEPFGPRIPEPIVDPDGGSDPEQQALLADSVGLALLVVLETLPPAERLAFVLHDIFAVPFDEIAPLVERSPIAARKLASRARQRVQAAPVPDADLRRQREIVDAFIAASREGDFDALLAVLHPDVVLRIDRGKTKDAWRDVLGARDVAKRGMAFSRLAASARPALVNGAAGLVVVREARTIGIAGFTVANGKIAEIDLLLDATRLRQLDLGGFEG